MPKLQPGTSRWARGGGTINHVNALTMGDGVNYPITGNGSFTKAGSGQMTLVTSNTYTGITTVAGGILQVDTGGTTAWIPNGLALTGGSVIYDRADSYFQKGLISGRSGNSSIMVTDLGAGNTNYLTFASGTNLFGSISNSSAGSTLILDAATNSINIANVSSSPASVLNFKGGVWNMSLAFAPGGSEVDFNGGTLVVMNAGGNGLQNFNAPNLVINSGGLILGAGTRYSNGADGQFFTINGGIFAATNTTYGMRFANNQGGGNQANLPGYYAFTGIQTGGLVFAPGDGEQRLSIGGYGPIPGGNAASYTMTGGQIMITNAGSERRQHLSGCRHCGRRPPRLSRWVALAGCWFIAYRERKRAPIRSLTSPVAQTPPLPLTCQTCSPPICPALLARFTTMAARLCPATLARRAVTTITGNYDITAGGACWTLTLADWRMPAT